MFGFVEDQKLLIIMQKRRQRIVLAVQMAVFAAGRIFDDITWHDIGVEDQVNIFESLSIACMLVCLVMQITRKRHIDGIWWILFIRSQLSFFIVWALQITTIILYFSTFSCQPQLPESQIGYFYISYSGCCLSATQIMVTTLNYSLVCNTKTEWGQFMSIQLILFGQIIYAGHLMIYSINHLVEKPKEYSLFLLTIIIANQMLMMDLIFRAAFEDRERQEANEKRLIHYYRKTFVPSYRQSMAGRHLSTPNTSHRSTRVAPLMLQPRKEMTISLRG